jgi:hypothetical protein
VNDHENARERLRLAEEVWVMVWSVRACRSPLAVHESAVQATWRRLVEARRKLSEVEAGNGRP